MIAEVFKQGHWSLNDSLEDQELRRLPRALPQTVLASRADSMSRKYLYAFARWRDWAEGRREATVFPVDEEQVALYLQHLAEATASKAAVENAVNAIAWAHRLAGVKSIADSPFVRRVRDELARQLARPVNEKEPVTLDMLSAMAPSSNDSLTDLRLLAMACLAYAAFLRCDELIKIRCCDISFKKSISISLLSSKSGQYREGAVVLVARSSSLTCPVMTREHYFEKAKLACNELLYVFRAIVHTKTGERLRRDGHLSYTRARELVHTAAIESLWKRTGGVRKDGTAHQH